MRQIISALLVPLSIGFCGTVSTQVIGGTGVSLGDYPWNVRIENDLTTCSGVLISSTMVLTSAHCISTRLSSYKIRIGGIDLNSGISARIPANVGRWGDWNPNATGDQVKNDIGLILLRDPVTTVKPVLISSIPMKVNQPAKVIGWGIRENSGSASLSTTLQQADVTSIDLGVCQAIYRSKNQSKIPDIQEFCAVSSNSQTQGACIGDSGGPLVVQEAVGWVLYGIVSGGISYCAQPNEPSYFEDISYYKEWLETNSVNGVQRYTEYNAAKSFLLLR